ncbi:uncharacterized protein LOC131630718 [Vicia villosa]|uniref:uncharacterized protein LOC131630718 n=1 Tax=Vicia villosa TaxID=3911 RepID=UPI00273CBA22|nr:uncharacterized protein LOC131630718 [Vicia villosa]
MAFQSFTDFSTNSSNPYYLHPNENPSLVLVTPLLDDKNYHTWARSMHIALISKNKERFIDGTLPKPPISDVLYAPWVRCNTMVLAWLHRSISESIAKSVLWLDSAVGVWRNLQIRFSQGKGKSSSSTPHSQSVASVDTGKETPQQSSSQSLIGLTEEQYHNILALLQQTKPPSQASTQANSITTSPFVLNSHSHNEPGKNPHLWILDTGATDHIAFYLNNFLSYKTIIPIHVSLLNGSHVTASISGNIAISPTLTLHNVLHIPNFHVNLLLIAKLVHQNNCHVQFTNDSCKILQNHSLVMIGTAKLQRGLYVLDSSPHPHACHSSAQNSTQNNANLWHLRLGHISHIGLQNISKLFPFIPSTCNNGSPCDPCHFSKQKRLSFPHSNTKSLAPFAILHADVWGPFSTVSMLGHRYFLTLVDDFSRYTWIVFLKTKNQTKDSIIQFMTYIETQFHTTLKCLRNGSAVFLNGFEIILRQLQKLTPKLHHSPSKFTSPQTSFPLYNDDPAVSHQSPSSTDLSTYPDNTISSSGSQQHNSSLGLDNPNINSPHQPSFSEQDHGTSAFVPLSTLDNTASLVPSTSNPSSDFDHSNPSTTSPFDQSIGPTDNSHVTSVPTTRHSNRVSNPPTYLADYHSFHTKHTHPYPKPNSQQVPYPLESVLSYEKCSPYFKHFCCSISSQSEPKTYKQAIQHEC